MTERQTETERQRQTDRQTYRQTDGDRDRETEAERFEPTATRFVSLDEPTSFPSFQTGLHVLIQRKQFHGLKTKRISASPTPSLKFNRPKTCPSISSYISLKHLLY